MGEEGKNPGWPFWTTVVLVSMLVGYPLSFGPACWVVTRRDDAESKDVFHHVYYPVLSVLIEAPEWLYGPVEWYLGLGAPRDSKPLFFRIGTSRGLVWNRPGYSYTALSR